MGVIKIINKCTALLFKVDKYFFLFEKNIQDLLLFIIKKDWQCQAGRGRLTPYQSEDPSPTLPTYRGKEEKGKIVKDKKEERN